MTSQFFYACAFQLLIIPIQKSKPIGFYVSWKKGNCHFKKSSKKIPWQLLHRSSLYRKKTYIHSYLCCFIPIFCTDDFSFFPKYHFFFHLSIISRVLTKKMARKEKWERNQQYEIYNYRIFLHKKIFGKYCHLHNQQKNSKKYLLSIPTYKKWQTSGGSLCVHIAQCFQDSNSLSKYCYYIVWTETNEETVN